jgi:5'-nucleotidase
MDRSGTTNFMAVVMDRRFHVEKRDLGDERIVAYALDGYPADCITFALSGPLRGSPPDLVISGINGGPNLGDSWFISGTIGAARTAAFYDIPAIAVSGVNKEDSTSVRAVADWVVALAGSELVRDLRPPRFLTVSLPLLPPADIRGVKLVRRAPGTIGAISRLEPGADGSEEVWAFELRVDESSADPDTDVAAVATGHIAIVPMRLDENDAEPLSDPRIAVDRLPAWPVGGR